MRGGGAVRAEVFVGWVVSGFVPGGVEKAEGGGGGRVVGSVLEMPGCGVAGIISLELTLGGGGWVYGEVSSVPVEMNMTGDSLPDKGCRGEEGDMPDFRRGDGREIFLRRCMFL